MYLSSFSFNACFNFIIRSEGRSKSLSSSRLLRFSSSESSEWCPEFAAVKLEVEKPGLKAAPGDAEGIKSRAPGEVERAPVGGDADRTGEPDLTGDADLTGEPDLTGDPDLTGEPERTGVAGRGPGPGEWERGPGEWDRGPGEWERTTDPSGAFPCAFCSSVSCRGECFAVVGKVLL